MFTGCFTALVTPFLDNSKLDLVSLERLIQFQLGAKVSGFVACGSTGEAATLTDAEYTEVIRSVKKIASTKPVIAGVNSSSTVRAVELALLAKDAGADAILLVTPPYNKPPQAGIIEHFRAVKKATALPIVAYNIPGRAALAISTSTLVMLATEGTIEAIKDSTGNLDMQLDTMGALHLSQQNQISMLAGDDSFVTALLALGARGVISAVANIVPKEFVQMTNPSDLEKSKNMQFELLPLIRLAFIETNPIPLKYMLKRKGIITSDTVRLPLVGLSEESRKTIDVYFEKLGFV